MNNQIPDAFLTHYEKYLGVNFNVSIFNHALVDHVIQIMDYSDVVPDCTVYCSLGLSHFSEEVQLLSECYCVADQSDASIPRMMAEVLFFMAADRFVLGRGTVIGNLQVIDQAFCEKWHKDAIYFTCPFNCPDGFETVHVEEQGSACMLAALFVSPEEHAFIQKHGAASFEKMLESARIDPYELGRASCC